MVTAVQTVYAALGPSIRWCVHSPRWAKLAGVGLLPADIAPTLTRLMRWTRGALFRFPGQYNSADLMADSGEAQLRGRGLHMRAAEKVLRDPSAAAIRDILNTSAAANVISFAGGVPAPDLIDRQGLEQAFGTAVSRSPQVFNYGTTAGSPRLREALAELSQRRGLRCGPDDILVTVGSQQGLDLTIAALTEPGEVVLVERPCYAAVLQILSLANVRVAGVNTDGEGLEVDAFRAALETTGARVLYTNPTFHNPTGACASLERRRALVRTAAEFACVIIEDDAYGFLSHDPPAPPALAALGEGDVVYVGSVSKIVSPGIRV